MRCNLRKHTKTEKAPANYKNIFTSLTTHVLQILTIYAQSVYLQHISVFGCIVSIRGAFLYLVML